MVSALRLSLSVWSVAVYSWVGGVGCGGAPPLCEFKREGQFLTKWPQPPHLKHCCFKRQSFSLGSCLSPSGSWGASPCACTGGRGMGGPLGADLAVLLLCDLGRGGFGRLRFLREAFNCSISALISCKELFSLSGEVCVTCLECPLDGGDLFAFSASESRALSKSSSYVASNLSYRYLRESLCLSCNPLKNLDLRVQVGHA